MIIVSWSKHEPSHLSLNLLFKGQKLNHVSKVVTRQINIIYIIWKIDLIARLVLHVSTIITATTIYAILQNKITAFQLQFSNIHTQKKQSYKLMYKYIIESEKYVFTVRRRGWVRESDSLKREAALSFAGGLIWINSTASGLGPTVDDSCFNKREKWSWISCDEPDRQ